MQSDQQTLQSSEPMNARLERIDMVEPQMAKFLSRMSGAQRLRIASDMSASARAMLLSHLRAEHPEWTQAQVTREPARRMSHGAV
jgi:hypothetical protein